MTRVLIRVQRSKVPFRFFPSIHIPNDLVWSAWMQMWRLIFVCLHTCMPFVIGIINCIFGMVVKHATSCWDWDGLLHLPSIFFAVLIYTQTVTVWKNCYLILLFSSVVTVSKLIKSNFIFANFTFNALHACKCETYTHWPHNAIINAK